jgi:hypothetical protein
MNWFKVLIGDLLGGILIEGFLESLIGINPIIGGIIAFILFFTDSIIYFYRGENIITKIYEILGLD